MNKIQLSDPPVPREWGSQLEPLLADVVKLPIEPQPKFVHLSMEYHTNFWQLAVHAMIRITWDSKYKIPDPRKRIRERALVVGQWLAAIRELCLEVHDVANWNRATIPYKTPREWFNAILLELYAGGFQQICYSLYAVEDTGSYQEPISPRGSINRKLLTKKREVRILSNVCYQAKLQVQPLERSKQYALGLLIWSSVKLADDFDNFKNRKYTPFVEAWRLMIDDIHQNWVTGEMTDLDKPPLIQVGKGRQKEPLKEIRLRKNKKA